MRTAALTRHVFALLLVVSYIAFAATPALAADLNLPPPSPPYTLLDPVVNEVSYLVEISNPGGTDASINATIALPKTWGPDTYIELEDVSSSAGTVTEFSYMGNSYLNLNSGLGSGESLLVNVTFLALKYDLAVSTRGTVRDLSYPNSLYNLTLPETYIESGDATLQSLASAVVGSSTNPFRIAEKTYSYTIAHLSYAHQDQIRGALWALQTGVGDCTEYSTLFTALMRAVGIPARTVTGHMSTVLSLGGVASAVQLWTDSPHMWAEFYVSGYGWVPVDPSSGESDPANHFALSDSRYLPVVKGQSMNTPYRSLVTIQSDQLESIGFNATLFVRPQADAQASNGLISSVSEAVDKVCGMRIAAESAYNYGFNVTTSYAYLNQAYYTLCNATFLTETGDIAGFIDQAATAQLTADTALQMISDIVIEDARASVDNAWSELRTLGALSAQRYLDKAEMERSNGDYEKMVVDASYAKMAADESSNITVFIVLAVFSGLTIWAIDRNHRPKT